MIKVLIGIHVLFGAIAVLGMLIALATRKGGRWHKCGGKTYALGMAVALSLSTLVAVLTSNLFLLSIGIFSAYLVYTGWRLAVAKDGARSVIDKVASNTLMAVGLLMIAYSAYLFFSIGDSLAIALAVFGVLAIAAAYTDYKSGDQWPSGKERIVQHLGRMGGASIATVTAVLVVNVQTDPAFIAWLMPTVVGSMAISYWTKRIQKQNYPT